MRSKLRGQFDVRKVTDRSKALPGVLGIQGEGLFIFRDLARRVIYFQGFGEKAYFWGGLWSKERGGGGGALNLHTK